MSNSYAYAATDWDVPRVDATVPAAPRTEQAFTIFGQLLSWVTLPNLTLSETPEPQLQAIELVKWTGLSRRVLSEILGTTHPTFGALVDGQPTSLSKSPEVLERLGRLHSLASRLAPFEIKMPGAMKAALLTHSDGGRVADLAANGAVTIAYLTALRVLAPHEEQNLRKPMVTRSVGTATVSLSD